MPFIENASHFSLSDGVYNNAHGNIYNFYDSKRRREEIEDGSDLALITRRAGKRRRLNEDDGIKIIRGKKLKLIREIGSGPGYLLHAGQKKGDAVIVKVFNSGPESTVRRQLESVVALSKGIMHPNVLRLLGMSSPESLSHFIVYENTHRQNAEGPLAVALKNDLEKSIRLGFKMIAGLSAGMNHLSVHGLSLGSMRVENFDIFLDVDDRFVICPHPPSLVEGDTAQEQEESAWAVFNALCQKTLMSANRVLHHDEIKRDSAILDVIESMSAEIPGESLLPSRPASSSSSKNTQEDELGIPPRREYVWRTIDRGRQSLETVASRIALDLDMDLSSLRRMTSRDGRSPHRCAGYVREEITLATTTFHSAVVAHNAPSPSELCPICHEVVGPQEKFWCACGDLDPGSRHTIKCQTCKFWSHSDCVESLNDNLICALCIRSPAERAKVRKREHGKPDSGYVYRPQRSGAKNHSLPFPAPAMLKRKQSEAAHTPPPPHIEVVVPAPRCRPTRPPKPPLTPPLPYQTTIIPKVYSALLASSSSSQSSSMAAWSMDGNASAAGPSSWVPQPQSFLPEADAGGLFTQHEMSSGFDYMPSFSAGYDFETSLRGRKARESSTLLPEPATLSKTVGEEAPISQPSIFDFERDSEMGLFTSKSRVPISDDSITQPAPTGTSDWVAVPPNSTGGKMRNYNWPGPHNSNGTPASPSTSAHSSGADNHIGHLALFNQLLQKGDPRVEWVYSDQHPFGPSEFGGGGSGGTARADTDSFAAGTGNKSTLVWSVQVLVDGEIFGRARGNTKKAARNECAKQGLVRMGVAV